MKQLSKTHYVRDVLKQVEVNVGADKMERIVLEIPITDGPLDGGSFVADADFTLEEKGWSYSHKVYGQTPCPDRPVMVRDVEHSMVGVIVHDLAVHNPGGNNDETWYYTAVYYGFTPDDQITLLWNRYLKE